MQNRKKIRLWSRYLLGISTKSERDQIYRFSESAEMMQEDWNNTSGAEIPTEQRDRVMSKINAHRSVSPFIVRYQTPIRVAAVVILVLALGAILRYSGILSPHQDFIEVVCEDGLRKKVLLPDGSVVTMAGGSSLLYPEEFEKNRRVVEMDGMAFFDVYHDPSCPFTVNSDNLEITVLGTEFSVTDFDDESTAVATLLSGKVNVVIPDNTQSGDITLLPGSQLLLEKSSNQTTVQQVDARRKTGWINGRLAFDQVCIDELCRSLERWYGVNITVEDEHLSDDIYTLTIENNSIDEVLALMHRISPMSYIVDGENVIILFEQN